MQGFGIVDSVLVSEDHGSRGSTTLLIYIIFSSDLTESSVCFDLKKQQTFLVQVVAKLTD